MIIVVYGIVCSLAIVSLTFLAHSALSVGIDGKVLISVAAIVGGICGVSIDQIKKAVKKWLESAE